MLYVADPAVGEIWLHKRFCLFPERGICTVVINHNQLPLLQGLGKDALYGSPKFIGPFIGGYNHRDFKVVIHFFSYTHCS